MPSLQIGQGTSLHCAVGNYNRDKHRVNWTALHQDQSYLDARAASSWDSASKTLNLSITFQNPGSSDEGLYFCELYYLTDARDILLGFTSAVLTVSTPVKSLECLKSGPQENVIYLLPGGENVDISCRVDRKRPIPELRWKALHGGNYIEEVLGKFTRYDDGM